MDRLAIYPGTFDPITNGHIDIVIRGAKIFDQIIIAVGENPHKSTLFSHDERVVLVRRVVEELGIPNITADHFTGLLVDYVRKMGAVAVIRGLRAVSDFEYELQLALANRKLFPQFESVFLMPAEQFIYLSSSMVKEIARNGGDISQFVPPVVEQALYEKFGGKK